MNKIYRMRPSRERLVKLTVLYFVTYTLSVLLFTFMATILSLLGASVTTSFIVAFITAITLFVSIYGYEASKLRSQAFHQSKLIQKVKPTVESEDNIPTTQPKEVESEAGVPFAQPKENNSPFDYKDKRAKQSIFFPTPPPKSTLPINALPITSRRQPLNRPLVMIALLNDAHRWSLSEEEQQQYATEIARFVPEDAEDQMLQQIITNYHADHEIVEQLRNIEHPGHEFQWNMWMSRAAGIIRQSGFAWSNDPAIDTEDLAQIAQVELIRSISSFTYHSRLSTWTYRVVVRSIQRFVRDSKVAKRTTRLDSLDHAAELDTPLSETEQPESQAVANMLAARTLAILAEHDERLALIFKLWAIQDQRVEEIAEVVRLHPSRVRTLLKQARDILLAHPDVRDWRFDEQHPDENAQ